MSRTRRFKVDSLTAAQRDARIELPETERRHVGVLRLQAGDEVELFDGQCAWLARLCDEGRAAILTGPMDTVTSTRPRLILATAWPKGKRAATLVEKCAELGVDEIVPLHCARSVVIKDTEGAGMERLRRIAAEAAKQSGRTTVPAIGGERTVAAFLGSLPTGSVAVMLDPRADQSLVEVLQDAARGSCWCFLIGPEGGFTAEELDESKRIGARAARLGTHVLRVETAAMAACAVAAAVCTADGPSS
jgi:16S rRNA (uracil1498-N3)-methyltransferase